LPRPRVTLVKLRRLWRRLVAKFRRRPMSESERRTSLLGRASKATAADLSALLSDAASLAFSTIEPNPILDALQALVARLGQDALPSLVSALRREDLPVPSLAAVLLGHVGGPGAVSALAECLAVDSPASAEAAAALGSIGGPEAVAVVLRRIRSPPLVSVRVDWRRMIDAESGALMILIDRHGSQMPESELREIASLRYGRFREQGLGWEDDDWWEDGTPYYRFAVQTALRELKRRGLDVREPEP